MTSSRNLGTFSLAILASHALSDLIRPSLSALDDVEHHSPHAAALLVVCGHDSVAEAEVRLHLGLQERLLAHLALQLPRQLLLDVALNHLRQIEMGSSLGASIYDVRTQGEVGGSLRNRQSKGGCVYFNV